MPIILSDIILKHYLAEDGLFSTDKSIYSEGDFYYYELKNTLHYTTLLTGDFRVYNKYITTTHQEEHSEDKFRIQSESFDIDRIGQFELRFIGDIKKWTTDDGLHRLAIMLFKGIIKDDLPDIFIKNHRQITICNELLKTTNNVMYNKWHSSRCLWGYHSFNIDEINIAGQRNPKTRLDLFRLQYNFDNKIILDLGCCVGGMLLHLKNINKGIGVDYDNRAIEAGKNIARILGKENIEFIQHDFDKDDYNLLREKIRFSPDIIFLLSMGSWVKKWAELYAFALSYKCPIVLETNNDMEGEGQLRYFIGRGCKISLLIDKSSDDITGNYARKTYFINNE